MKKQKVALTEGNFMDFLESLVSGRINPKMTNAVVAQFGGWQDFVDNSMDLVISGGCIAGKQDKRQKLIKGWESQALMSAFYAKNKADILELAKSRTDTQESQTIVEMVSEFALLAGEYDLDDVAAGMHVPNCAEYAAVSSALAYFSAKEVSYAYEAFKSITDSNLYSPKNYGRNEIMTKSAGTILPAQKVTLAGVASYLGYLKHLSVNTDDKAIEEPEVSQKARDTALAIVNGLGGINYFMQRDEPRWLFQGWVGITPKRQHEATVFFYDNKDNFIEVIDDIIEIKGGVLSYWLLGLCVGAAEENYLLELWQAIRADDEAGDTSPVTTAGMIIAQVLYQILYHAELEHHTNHHKNLQTSQ